MSKIEEMMQRDFWNVSIPDFSPVAWESGYKAGANYVLEQIEQLIYEKHVKGNLPLFDLTYLIDKLKEE